MTQLEAIREFVNEVLETPVVISNVKYEGFNFGIIISYANPRLVLPKDLNCKIGEDDKQFRNNFISRCPLARGFSHITVSLLHECGHWETRSVMDDDTYRKMRAKVSDMETYMAIPWEHLATDWAICWLSSPKNRKRAKEFERKYFGYGND